MNAYAVERLTPEDFRPHIEVDAALGLDELNDASVAEVLSLAPFGAGNPAPQFALYDAEVVGPPSVFAEKHLRLRLRQNGRFLQVKAWHAAACIEELQPGSRLDVILTLEEDAYSASRGYAPWSAQLRDWRPHGIE